MKREDFIFTIGFQGATAIIDAQSRKRYGSHSTMQLVEAGLYCAAFRSALYGDEEERQSLLAWFRSHVSLPNDTFDGLKRLFGVFEVPDERIKIIAL